VWVERSVTASAHMSALAIADDDTGVLWPSK
jgi:hypothetical protein